MHKITLAIRTPGAYGSRPERMIEMLPPIRAQKLFRAAAETFNTTEKDILGPSRYQIHFKPRAIISLIMNEDGKSTALIGKWLGRDHSTIVHAIHRARYMTAKCPHTRAAYLKLKDLYCDKWVA